MDALDLLTAPEEVEDGLQEHRVVDVLIEEAQALQPGDAQWIAKMNVFSLSSLAAVRAHSRSTLSRRRVLHSSQRTTCTTSPMCRVL